MFVIKNIEEFTEHSKILDEVLKKLEELKRRNTILVKKYKGDVKFARIHKRIHEENQQRAIHGRQPLVSTYDETILDVLMLIKNDIDQKVFDRNDILKKDAYFEQTVMQQIKIGMDQVGISETREDRVFIQSRIARQYLDQYNATYPAA